MKLYNTLAGEAQEFTPADGKSVKMYVCGVTPYSSTHVGHALSYVAFDVLRRYLEYLGYQVEHVQNFTDVDDKIIQRAQDAGLGAGGGEVRAQRVVVVGDGISVVVGRLVPRGGGL